jgi:alpha-glucosidase
MDPIGKTFWPLYKGRDGCRAPMQWRNGVNAGFSQEEPWLPVHENFPQRNVDQQASDPESLLNFVKKIIRIRRAEPALQRGDFTPLIQDPRRLLAFQRTYQDDQLIVILNFSSFNPEFQIPLGKWNSLIEPGKPIPSTLSLKPYEVEILKKQHEPYPIEKDKR